MPHHLSRIFWLCAALCVGAMVALPAPRSSAAAPTTASAHAAVSDFVVAINETRSINGLQPLTVHPAMVTSAAQWTEGMVNRSHLSHASTQHLTATNPAGLSKIGENVGRGRSIESLFAAFMASPGHRNNILDPDFTHIGVAVVQDPGSGRLYTTHRFAAFEQPEQTSQETVPTPTPTPRATLAPPPAPEPESELSLKVAPEGTASIVAALERGSRRVVTPEPLQRRGDRRATD